MTWGNGDIMELFRKLKPVIGKRVYPLWMAYQANPGLRRDIEAMLHMLAEKHLGETFESREILLEPPPKEAASGGYQLGTVCYGERQLYPFGMREEEFIRHVLIAGMSGSGKTNSIFTLMSNLLGKGKPFIAFDYKANLKDILQVKEAKDVLVFTPGRDVSPFPFNPLRPPPGSGEAYLRDVVYLIVDTFIGNPELLSYKGAILLISRALETVKETEETVRPSELFRVVGDYRLRGREGDWKPSALFCLERMCNGPPGNVYNPATELDLSYLSERQAIFELNFLGDEMDKALFVKLLLNYFRHRRMSGRGREEFRTAWILEESHNLFSQVQSFRPGRESLMDKLIRENREFGDSYVIVDQSPSLLPRTVLGNVATKIAFTLSQRDDIMAMADSMLLGREEVPYLGRLGTGEAIIKVQDRWPSPFLVKFELFPIGKGLVSDDDVRERMKAFSGFYHLKGDKIFEKEGDRGMRSPAIREEKEKPLTGREKSLLVDVLENPKSKLVARYVRCGLNSYQGNRAKNSLVARGLIDVVDVPTMTGCFRHLELTEKGRKVAEGIICC